MALTVTRAPAGDPNRIIGLEVHVDDAPLVQYPHSDGRVYIESNLTAKSSYCRTVEEENPWGEIEERDVPVTPFKVKVRNQTSDKMWLEVLVDGSRVHYHCLNAQAEATVEEMVIKGKKHELLFTMPRFRTADERADDPAVQTSTTGTITVRLYHATMTGQQYTTYSSTWDASNFKRTCGGSSARATNASTCMLAPCAPLTKHAPTCRCVRACLCATEANKDAAFAAGQRTNTNGLVSTTAPGRIKGHAPAPETKMCTMYTVDKVAAAERTLTYRQRDSLEALGLVPAANDAKRSGPVSEQPKAQKRARADRKPMKPVVTGTIDLCD